MSDSDIFESDHLWYVNELEQWAKNGESAALATR
jgi:hypothetical protein